jgi:hypothetical protein
MDNVLQGNFYNPSCGNLTLEAMLGEIVKYAKQKPEKFYDVIVGCDSSSEKDPIFPIAVVVLRKGEGGRFFLRKIHFNANEQKRFKNWRMRIIQEVILSCELALYLKGEIEKRMLALDEVPHYEFRYIHADVGENGETREMIKEVVGLIKGNGFEPKIKPESFVASAVADKYC